MSTDSINKEDVPATIAGFYYQALLACKEITELAQKDDEPEDTAVGIEKGADVRIKKTVDKYTSVEAKFYGENFRWNSKPITHTIYNFYKNSFDDDELRFVTNVNISDDTEQGIEFSKKEWYSIEDDNIDIYIDYIHFCLIKEVVFKAKKKNGIEDDNTPYDNFLEYKNANDYGTNNQEYILKIIEECKSGSLNLKEYVDIKLKDRNEEISLIKKFIFKFSEEEEIKKLQSIKDLKEEINNNIGVESQKGHIINLLLDRFLSTTIEIKDENQWITISDYKDICKNAQSLFCEFLKEKNYKELIDKIDEEEKSFFEKVEKSTIEEKEKIKNNYNLLRKIIFLELNSENIDKIIKQFSVKNDGNLFTIIKLLKYVSVLTSYYDIDINLLELNKDETLSNLFFSEVNKYTYKFSERDDFDEFIKFFITDTIELVRKNYSYKDIPIITDIRQEKPCEANIDIEDLITDIADTRVTENEQEVYESLDYRCTYCLNFKTYINNKDNFHRCLAIKEENNERDS